MIRLPNGRLYEIPFTDNMTLGDLLLPLSQQCPLRYGALTLAAVPIRKTPATMKQSSSLPSRVVGCTQTVHHRIQLCR